MKPAVLRLASLASAIALSTMAVAAETAPKVVASIKPIHSLVAAVMQGVGKPDLLVDGAGSPHTYALKPSQAAALQEANLVFWIGHDLEAFLEKPLKTLATKAKTVELMDAHDLVKLEFREGGAFEAHDHTEHDEQGHEKDDHAHKDQKDEHHKDDDHADKESKDKHDHEKTVKKDHDHKEGHDDHDDHEIDPHVWLDPVNAKALVHEIEEALVEANPANAAKYEANAKALTASLDNLVAEISTELKPVQGRGFVVFHDAYHYFEARFGLAAAGSITVSPEVMPGAARLGEIRTRLKSLGATCVFAEPQFQPKLVSVVIEGTSARAGVIDPLGATLDPGPGLYISLIRNMSQSLHNCLSKPS